MRSPTSSLIAPAALLFIAVLTRGVVALQTAIPGRDGVTYLWIAEQIASGDLTAAFTTVFHPVYPLLVAAVLGLVPGAVDPVAAGQLVAGGFGALAVLPLHALARRWYGTDAALATGLLYALGVWFARYPADCMSEGPFFFLVATTLLLIDHAARPRPGRGSGGSAWLAGLLIGIAYGTRPEGASLLILGAPWLFLCGARLASVFLLIGAGLGAAPWVLGFALLGPHGWTLTPKLAFNLDVGIGDATGGGPGHYLGHLVQVPGELCEALGFVAAPLILLGLWWARPWRLRHGSTLVVALVLLQIAVIPFLRSHFRFLAGYGFVLLIFAGVAWRTLRPHWARIVWPGRWLLVLLVFSGDLIRIPQPRRTDRLVERDLGRRLGLALRPREEIATDMPRLAYFAGQRPGPPRRVTVDEIVAASASPRTRYVVVVRPRTPVTGEQLGPAFERVDVPGETGAAVAERSIVLYRRMP